jgi:UDP-N-acetylmuramoyl-tripeptide--D-alanyl-D-alanine ligase
VGEFGGPDAVEKAKSEMVTDLPDTATAVLNADDHRVARMAALTQASVVWFGLDEGADVRASDIEATATGTAFTLHADGESRRVQLRILGEHHVMNALAALAASRAMGVPLERSVRALETVARAARWRMEVQPREDGVVVINDAYNASPDSMAAALKTLAQVVRPGERSVAVLGEMAELGEYADEEHDRIGRLVVRLNIHKLVVVGHGARHIHNAAGLEGSWDGESVLVGTADEAYDVLREELREGDVVLVKSSGSAGLRFLGDRIAGVTE